MVTFAGELDSHRKAGTTLDAGADLSSVEAVIVVHCLLGPHEANWNHAGRHFQQVLKAAEGE